METSMIFDIIFISVFAIIMGYIVIKAEPKK
jgi:hypothetical protein